MIRLALGSVVTIFSMAISLHAGDLNPPGAPTSTLVDLQTINENAAAARSNASSAANEAREAQDPRTPITAIPVTIEEPGSYYLTGNLTLSASASAHGILVLADDVTIDLNGFTLAAQDFTSGSGVLSLAGSRTAVLNGSVMGWGAQGIDLSAVDDCTVRDINAADCGETGIHMGDGFLMADCRAARNGDDGIRTGNQGSIRDCRAVESFSLNFLLGNDVTAENLISEQNQFGSAFSAGENATLIGCHSSRSAFSGFEIGAGSSLRDCHASHNGGTGIFVQPGSTLEGCTASSNEGHGIRISDGGVVRGCAARFNTGRGFQIGSIAMAVDCVATFNGGHGFRVGFESFISGCQANFNGTEGEGVGFEFLSESRIENNHATSNDIGFRAATSLVGQAEDCVVVGNTAVNNSTANYDINSTLNTVGAIQTAHGSLTSSNPWLNFSH